MGSSPRLAPPPDLSDPSLAIPSVAHTTTEKVLGGIGSRAEAFAGNAPGSFEQSSVGRALQAHYDSRLADARRHYQNSQTYASALSSGDPDPQTGEPTGIDPASGQPMTPETRAQYKQQLEGAWGDYEKSAGVNKDVKAGLQQRKSLMDVAVSKGAAAAHKLLQTLGGTGGGTTGGDQAAGGAGAQPPAAGAGSASSPTSLPAPPTAGAGGAASAPPTSSPSPASPAATPAPASPTQAGTAAGGAGGSGPGPGATAAALPAPPTADLAAAHTRQQIATNDQISAQQRLTNIATQGAIERLGAGFGPTATYTNPADGTTFTGRPAKIDGQVHNVDTGEVVANATKATAGQQSAPTVATDNGGVPYAVKRGGKTLTPDSPDWTKNDQSLLDSATKAYQTGEAGKIKRQEIASQSYAKMRGQVMQYPVIDVATGLPTFANADSINANPGKYAPATITQQLKNRAVIFDEINYTSGQFSSALDGMTEDDFKALPRAQIAAVLKDRDPSSALSQFVGSTEAATLSPKQIDYITGLVSMKESAMSLRTIGGMGQGSDRLRSAIDAMLPSGATPSKAYANRQMQLFNGELNQLRKAVPMSGGIGIPEDDPALAAASAPKGSSSKLAAPPSSGPPDGTLGTWKGKSVVRKGGKWVLAEAAQQ